MDERNLSKQMLLVNSFKVYLYTSLVLWSLSALPKSTRLSDKICPSRYCYSLNHGPVWFISLYRFMLCTWLDDSVDIISPPNSSTRLVWVVVAWFQFLIDCLDTSAWLSVSIVSLSSGFSAPTFPVKLKTEDFETFLRNCLGAKGNFAGRDNSCDLTER